VRRPRSVSRCAMKTIASVCHGDGPRAPARRATAEDMPMVQGRGVGQSDARQVASNNGSQAGRRRRIPSLATPTPPWEHAMPGLLHDEVAREPVGSVNDDRAHPIAPDALEEGHKARALSDRIGALTARHHRTHRRSRSVWRRSGSPRAGACRCPCRGRRSWPVSSSDRRPPRPSSFDIFSIYQSVAPNLKMWCQI
jgi:hypothetical protein